MNRFRYGHEVAFHIRMGDGYGSATLNLAFEDWDDTAPTPKDIAKADNGISLPGALRSIQDDQLRQPLW